MAGLGPGIHLGPGASTTRISACYIDNTWLNIVDPNRVTVLDGFFYQAYTTLVAGPRSVVAGLVMQGNIYSGPLNRSNIVVSGQFNRENVTEVELDDDAVRFVDSASPTPTVATSVSLSSFVNGETLHRFEFSTNQSAAKQLLFPWVDVVAYSVVFGANSGQFVQHFAELVGDSAVDIHFERPVTATVSVTATQGQHLAG